MIANKETYRYAIYLITVFCKYSLEEYVDNRFSSRYREKRMQMHFTPHTSIELNPFVTD